MSRTTSTAPLDGARRVRRPGDTLRGLASGLLLLGIVAGIPAALVIVVGNPIPEIPRDPLGGQVPIEFVLDVIVCIVWLAWAQLVSCLIVELVAGVARQRAAVAGAVRGRRPAGPRPPADHRGAVAGHRRARAAERARAGRPAASAPAAVASVSGAMDKVAVTTVGQADTAARQADQARTAPARTGGSAGTLHGTKQYVVMPPQGGTTTASGTSPSATSAPASATARSSS